MQWYIHRQGQSVPVDPHQLRMMAQSGELRREDVVYPPGGNAWVPASSLSELEQDWPQSIGEAPAPPAAAVPSIVVPRAPINLEPSEHGEQAWHARNRPTPSTWQDKVRAGAADLDLASVEALLRQSTELYLQNWQPILTTSAILLAPAALLRVVLQGLFAVPVEPGLGSFLLAFLSLVASFVAALLVQGLAWPWTRAALTVTVADLVLDQEASWQRSFGIVLRQIIPLLGATLPAALLVAVGTLLFFVPGLVLAGLFAFVTPVVLCERRTGLDALRRSVDLVLSDWVRVAVVIVVLAVLGAVAHALASIVFVPAHLLGGLLEAFIELLLLPLPLMATVLLYFQARTRLDGSSVEALSAEMER